MERRPCAECGRPVLFSGGWEGEGRILCCVCWAGKRGAKLKCWECVYYLRDDHAGYCKMDGKRSVDGKQDACELFLKP